MIAYREMYMVSNVFMISPLCSLLDVLEALFKNSFRMSGDNV